MQSVVAPSGRSQAIYVGIEIGGSKLQVVAGPGPGEIRRRWRGAVRKSAGGAGIQRQLQAALAEVGAATGARAVGVGFGGPVDRSAGRVRKSHQIDGWDDFDLAGWVSAATGAPAAIENDANVAALAEAAFGAGVGRNPVFYVTLGSGVGGGLVVDGAIYHGAAPGESEFGHLRLNREGATVETRCSGWAIDKRVRELASAPGSSYLAAAVAGQPSSGGEARHIARALAVGDADVQDLMDELATDLALALSHVIHLAHPDVIVLGGGLALIGEPLRAAVARELPRFVMEAFSPLPDVRLSKLGEDAVPVGAIELARRLAP